MLTPSVVKIHGVFLLKKQFGKGFREIFEGSPVFHPNLREIYRIESVIFTACEILSNCKEFVYVVATLREQSIFIIARSSFVDIAMLCELLAVVEICGRINFFQIER